MSLKPSHGRFDAWVEIDGKRAEEYASGVQRRTAICLTKSRVGAEVAIYVQEFPSSTPASARADVFIDGVHVGKSVLSPSRGPCCFAGSWVSDTSLRPFVFTLAKKNDRRRLSEDAGTIEIRISEIVVVYDVDEDEDLYVRPEPTKEWEPPSVAEDEEIERHIIVIANSVRRRKYNPRCQSQNFHSRPFDSKNPEPIAIFEFIYGPGEFVSRELRRIENAKLEARNSGMTRTFNRTTARGDVGPSNQAKKRARSCDTYDGWSSSSSEVEFTRCADAEMDCAPRGGRSKICRKCSRGSDLRWTAESAEETKRRRNVRRPDTGGTTLRRRNRPRTTRPTDKRVWCETSDPNTETEVFSEIESESQHSELTTDGDVEGVDDRSTTSSLTTLSTRSQSVYSHQVHSENRIRLDSGVNQEGSSQPTDVSMPSDIIEVLEAEKHIQAPLYSTRSETNPGSTKRSPITEQTLATNASNVFGILQSSRTFASQLMELTFQSEQPEIPSSAVMDLLRECDRLSSRLRGSIFPVKKEEKPKEGAS